MGQNRPGDNGLGDKGKWARDGSIWVELVGHKTIRWPIPAIDNNSAGPFHLQLTYMCIYCVRPTTDCSIPQWKLQTGIRPLCPHLQYRVFWRHSSQCQNWPND